jgi:5-formyltetrahydrofolate cyclo-ligase
MTKTEIRNIMLEKRMTMSKEKLEMYSKEAVQKIQRHPLYLQANNVGVYHPIKNELNILSLLKDKKSFALPVVHGDSMHYHPYQTGNDLVESELHIQEPITNKIVDATLDLLIVPALAVTLNGDRLGYGKGFFDKFIDLNPTIKTLAVVTTFQVLKALPQSLHDKKIDQIIIVGDAHDY